MSNPITFDEALFRSLFPAFADATKYPTSLLVVYWDEIGCYIADGGVGGMLTGDCTVNAMNCLLAHFLALMDQAKRGKQTGYKTGAGIDKVNVQYLAPPAKSQFDWWLASTPYGQQLAALLELRSVGGLSVGGLNERGGFRKAGGIFL